MLKLFYPNHALSRRTVLLLVGGQVCCLVAIWALGDFDFLPSPLEIARAFKHLLANGLLQELGNSLWVNAQAMCWTVVISLAITYLSVLPFLRPVVQLVAKLRFLTLVGLTFFFTLWAANGNELKVWLLVFGMSVFLITSLLDVLHTVPQNQLNHARTLGMPEWRVVLETQFLGRADLILDAIRQNFAISWMMLTMVEGITRSEGGIGVLLLNSNRHFQLDNIFAIQFLILLLGIGQDWFLGSLKSILTPWSQHSNPTR